ncbi:MAG: AtpZ/AtpI family protein [Robiginitomaculum sp.]|nr:AtpZ/AtpI family protein [Robiginitomaculum sp.]
MPERENLSSDQDRPGTLEKVALEQLGEKLKSAKAAQEPEIDENKTGWAVGVNYASAFVGSVVVAGAIGYSIDHFANTKPWGMMAGIIIGFIAGTRSIVQMANRMNAENSES